MEIIFKIITNGVSAGKEKVLDTDFQLSYPNVNQNMMWRELRPLVVQATRTYVLPYIGRALYDDLVAKVHNPGVTLTSEQAELAEYLRDVVAYYTVMIALPKKKTVLASMGSVGNAATEGTTTSALWEFKSTLWSVTQDADRLCDEMLALLESYAAVPYFDLWKSNPAFERGASALFRTTQDFQKYHSINGSRRTFVALLPLLGEVAEEKILPILCDAQYQQLATQIRGNNLTDPNKKLLHLVRKALAKWTVFNATDALPVMPEHDGFRVVSSLDGVDARTFAVETIKGGIMGIQVQAERSARTATADLLQFLYGNADDYPLWRDSDCNRAGSCTMGKVEGGDSGAVFF